MRSMVCSTTKNYHHVRILVPLECATHARSADGMKMNAKSCAINGEMNMTKSECGRIGGKAKTEKKAEAARENGKKGGRPRKKPK